MRLLLLPAALAVTLAASALAGGAGPRPLVPDFAAASGWTVDCDEADGPVSSDGCRLRVPLPPGTVLPTSGGLELLPGNDRLTVLYHAPHGTREVFLCCGLQLPLSPLPGTDVWVLTARVRNVDRAVLSLGVVVDGGFGNLSAATTWRGSQAPRPAPQVTSLTGRVDRFSLTSGDDLTGTREITVYTPPGWTPAEALPAVYLGDGGMAAFLAQTLEPAVLAGQAPRVVLVGIESAPSRPRPPGSTTDQPGEDRRAQEYLEGWEGGQEHFTAHERFVLETVLPHVEREYHLRQTPGARAVGGVSNGAAWAISMAARHPDVFGGVLALSPSNAGRRDLPGPQARVFASGGTLEPSFLGAAREYAASARIGGRAARLVERVGGHDQAIWQEVFPQAVAFALRS